MVTIVIHINDLYVVGFHSNNPDAAEHTNAYFYLKDDKKPDGYSDAVGLFEGATAQPLGYGVQYGSLGNRETTRLGRDALIGAVKPLYTRRGSYNEWKKHFLVLIQMISECVRFDYILNRIVPHFDTGVLPDVWTLRLENNWGTLSDAVRKADKAGNLQPPIITLPPIPPDQEPLTVNHISLIILHGLVSLLKRPGSKSSPRHFQYCSPYGDQNSLIMENPMITTSLPVLQQQDHHGTSVLAAGEELEITTRIAGPNGMCLDVSGGEYHDGKEVFLWPCKSDNSPNQLWTFEKDGTVRSNNYCLMTYCDCPTPKVNYIMIYPCPKDRDGGLHVGNIEGMGP
ncbi:hypothetical protein Tsubulata_033111 [Turnera subulata]|uniref:Ribosome-inactivating protein n=1 Tax=Turnera subulata TaxID=218843 RepID=A0A9Q0J542_9ROSI|nr:hypothetical protein Tsubulata_033111 [Turnera subulata]